MSPAMPSSRSRRSASTSSPSRIRSPALSCATRSMTLSHSGVAYSGWLPTSRYSRAPFRKNTLLLRPQDTTRRNRYRATSSGDSRRCPRKVHVTPYSFSTPKIRRSTRPGYVPSPPDGTIAAVSGCPGRPGRPGRGGRGAVAGSGEQVLTRALGRAHLRLAGTLASAGLAALSAAPRSKGGIPFFMVLGEDAPASVGNRKVTMTMGIDYQRLYEYRFRGIDQASRQAVWTEIAACLYRRMGEP